MKFIKIQGAGNDFIVLDANADQVDWLTTAKVVCDRHFGVGADGVILVSPSKTADFKMNIYNSDGSEAEMCGNGIRCLAQYLVYTGKINQKKELAVETLAGERKLTLYYKGKDLCKIQVSMGLPKFEAAEIPVIIESGDGDSLSPALNTPILDYPLYIGRRKYNLSLISMGNPHAVYFTERKVSNFPLSDVGPKIENNKIFPKRINFEVSRVLSRSAIEARVWERGAAETLACGTGACAIAVAAKLHNFIDDRVDIILPGGTLNIVWNGRGKVFMSGPAEVVFTGEWPNK